MKQPYSSSDRKSSGTSPSDAGRMPPDAPPGLVVATAAEDGDVRFAATDPLTRPLVTVLPFQRLVSAAAVRLDANPDLTHLEAEPWASAIRAVHL